ncbi:MULTISPECIES: hypothetical protein [Bacillus cereus group]|uniref:hypothetical protein n=1 Tax=Bacillus cereus group TaxID=86661 RepID=UPI0021CEBBC1|nr:MULTISPECIES: hypothetical protein [Bacillus cereus group]HDR7485355.1 hypothetical protein [Bacillus pacificus]MCU5202078.1 hypothetical protein [Bacillus paranthracis]MDA2239800.1 hypothetical protein [Bacillus cereus group sp. Bc222]MED0974020.1 hypothetical protein [Bacillus paranthracis]MED1137134.1 hypothetical protein [Bacillus paranthracis]
MAKGSTKYQLLKDDFDFAVKQLKERREEIEKLRAENEMLRHENLRFKKENEVYSGELATCREHLLPLMEPYEDYDDLFCMTVADPLAVKDLCERVAEEFYALK